MGVRQICVRLTEEQFKQLKRELVLRNLTVQKWLGDVVEELIRERR